MEDVLVLLSSKNGKYAFFGENNAVLSLQSCHLSENAQDSQSIFIVGESDEWHKWDLKASDKHRARQMVSQINLAKHRAPRVGGVEKRRQDEKRYEEMRARAKQLRVEDCQAQERIGSLLSEQMERQKDFLHWAAGKNSQLGDSIEHQLDLIEANQGGHETANALFDRVLDITERLKSTSTSSSKDDTKLHKAETFNGFDSSSSKSSLSPPNDSTSTTATEMAMTITMLRKQFAALLEHQNELNGKLLLANQYAGFRGSRGVLEAEQARLQRMYTDQQKELEDETRRNGEEKLRVEKERREVEQRKARLEEREQVCDKSEKDLRKKWDEYQQNALALRNTRNRLSDTAPNPSITSPSSGGNNNAQVEHRNSGSSLTRDSASFRDSSLNSSHQSSTSLHRAPKKSSAEKNQRRIEHHPARKPDQQNLPTHLKFSAVNQLQTGDQRASMRSLNTSSLASSGSSKALLDLAANSQLPTKLATSTSRGKLKKI